jgi:hypothetical protein
MSGEPRSRRDLLRTLRDLGGLALVVGGAAACKKEMAAFSCSETAGLAPDEQSARTTLAYVEPAADKTRTCASCQQFVPAPSDGACGSCKVLKGPVHPNGTCKVFTAKPA